MSDWSDLWQEFDRWRDVEGDATLWWRDDDASGDTPELRRLLSLATGHKAPVTLAVIPARLSPNLAALLESDGMSYATPVQHGFAHANNTEPGSKKSEFVDRRPTDVVRRELKDGLMRLRPLPRFRPIFVPPWNRGLEIVRPILRDLGFEGVSAFGPRDDATAKPLQVNTHVDIVDWRGDRGFVGTGKALDQLIRHLRNRRIGAVDANEPTGLLTHHLDHDEGCWRFLDELFERTRRTGVRWLTAQEVFAP